MGWLGLLRILLLVLAAGTFFYLTRRLARTPLRGLTLIGIGVGLVMLNLLVGSLFHSPLLPEAWSERWFPPIGFVTGYVGQTVGLILLLLGVYRVIQSLLPHLSEHYSSLVERSLVGVYLIQDGVFKFVNPRMAEIFGYEREEVLGKNVLEFVSPESRPMVADKIRKRIAGEELFLHYQFTGLKKNGEAFEVEVYGTRTTYEGRPAVHGTLLDVTDRKQAEEALRESEERFRKTFEDAPIGMAIVDLGYRLVKVNKTLCEMLGYTEPELVALTFVDITHPEDIEQDVRLAEQLFKGEIASYKLEKRYIKKNREVLWIDLTATVIRDQDGNPLYGLGMVENITERKRAEEALRQSEERYRDLVQGLDAIVWEADAASWQFSFVSQQAEAILGYPVQQWLTEPNFWVDHIHPDDREQAVAYCRECTLQGRDHEFEYRALAANGREVWLRDIIRVIQDREGLPRQLRGLMIDITARKRMEEELLKAEKLESIGLLAGGIAHDFNNLLMGITGNISLAKMYAQPKDKIFDRLAAAESAATRARDLTQQLLTFSRGGTPIKKPASLGDLIREATEFALRGSDVRCDTFLPDDLWLVEMDAGQISQVISNLMINADQAMPQGGIVQVRAENVIIEADQGLPLPAGRYVQTSVEDHGIGIPADHLPKIFDPYFTTKQKGSGLGLATAYSIIKKHGGHIAVRSDLGVGTTFTIYLPASGKDLLVKAEAPQRPLVGQGKILLMDDEEIVREVAGQMLTYVGYEVKFARDGAEAIALYRQAKEAGQPFDVVIMDLTVPGGMGGREAIQKLREVDPQVKAIVSSGYSDDPVMAEFRKHGFRGFVAKPYKIQELSQAVHRAINDNN